MTNINLVTADTLKGTLELSSPALSLSDAKQKVAQWVEGQDRFWPVELTSEVLTSDLQEIYAAHWILFGEATSLWSASIGTEHKRIAICSTCSGKGKAATVFNGMSDNANCTTCDGSGRVEEKYTVWNNQSGIAKVVLNGKVIENVADNTPIRCGKRDFNSSGKLLSKPFPSAISVLTPENTSDETGLKLATQHLQEELEDDANKQASNLGSVRNLRLANMQTTNIKGRTWLYPLYAGTYTYNEKPYLIEIDGITGQLSIPQPPGVIAKRAAMWIAIIVVVIAVMFGLGLLVGWW